MRGFILFSLATPLLLFVSRVSGNHGEFVSMDPINDANWSSVVGMRKGYRVFTNVPDVGLTETFAVTHADGMYIAGEKVATVREVESVKDELQNTHAELQNIRAQLSHALTSLAALQSSCSHPPTCTDPSGVKLQFNGTNWSCVCNLGYYGESCQFGPTEAPTLSTTFVPTQSPTPSNAWLTRLDNMQKVIANDGSSGDRFGWGFALSSTHLVVGAYRDDDLGSNSGSVYMYSVSDSGATLVQKITANDGSSGDGFGIRVALSSTHLVVGAYLDDDLGSNSGSVYLYSVSDSGATLVQKVTADDGSSGDQFGHHFALSSTHLVVGTYANTGSVYLYSVSDSGTTLIQKITANDGSSSDNFGNSVALSGTHLVVAASGDDDLGPNSGSVYLYSVSDSGATLVQKLTANDGSSDDRFGGNVALSSTHLVVGNKEDLRSNSGSVYLYSVSDSGATLVQKVTGDDYFGSNVALSSTHLAVGAYGDDVVGSDAGSVYLA